MPQLRWQCQGRSHYPKYKGIYLGKTHISHINQFVKSEKTRVFVDMIHLSEVGVALKKPASSTSTSNPFQISCSQLEHHLSRQPRPCSRMSFSGFLLLSGWKEPRLGIRVEHDVTLSILSFLKEPLVSLDITWFKLLLSPRAPAMSLTASPPKLRSAMKCWHPPDSVQAPREWDDIVHRETGFLEPVFFFFSQQFCNQIWENFYKP